MKLNKKETRKIGVYLDHQEARLIEPVGNGSVVKRVESAFTPEEKEFARSKSENLMHNKEQGEQAAYYKEIGELVKAYEEILLFGPTPAKKELYNFLRADRDFEKSIIWVKQTDKLPENHQEHFVREHFLLDHKT